MRTARHQPDYWRRAAVTVLALCALLGAGLAGAQGQAPLAVGIALTNSNFLLADRSDAIRIVLTLANIGVDNVLAPKGFGDREDFHLSLIFTDPRGNAIIADAVKNRAQDDPPPPRVLFDATTGQALQVAQVEALKGTATGTPFVLEVTIPNARTFYTLTTSGFYTVQAVIPFRSYSRVERKVGTALFAALDAINFEGELKSNRERIALVADADGDGYSFPLADPRISQFAVPDCDDSNAAVNPGATEIFGNGIDDDCNPDTSDEPPAVRACDVNADGAVDINDVSAIMSRRNQPASGADDPADADGDGTITVLDARRCVLECDKPQCAP